LINGENGLVYEDIRRDENSEPDWSDVETMPSFEAYARKLCNSSPQTVLSDPPEQKSKQKRRSSIISILTGNSGVASRQNLDDDVYAMTMMTNPLLVSLFMSKRKRIFLELI